MTALPKPGCLVRSALVSVAILFFPMAIWFAYTNFHRYWGRALVLAVVSIAFAWQGLSRKPDSWLSTIDDLGH